MDKKKSPSDLVLSVVALDDQFSNLVQLGAKIDELNLKSNSDFDQADRLIARFNEVALGVSDRIGAMSKALTDARVRAESATQSVTAKAEELQVRKNEIQSKMDEFRALGEKVSLLTVSLSDLQPFAGQSISEEDRAKIAARFAEIETQLRPLIAEAQHLKEVAQQSKIKVLEQSADSMYQSLMAVSRKMTMI